MITAVESATLKLGRAAQHLDALNKVVQSLSVVDSYEIVRDVNGKETVNFKLNPPSEISILAGEIIHHIRSSMDHMAFALVKLNPGRVSLPPSWDEHCLFPLWVKVPQKPPAYNCFQHILPGITKPAFTFVEGVQPYHTGPGVHNVMRLIAQLSNVDKHRYLNVTIPRVSVHLSMTLKGDVAYDVARGGYKHSSQIETESFVPSDATDVQRRFIPYVTFDEPTVGDGPATLEVQHVLEVCLQQVETVIVPEFAQLLNNP